MICTDKFGKLTAWLIKDRMRVFDKMNFYFWNLIEYLMRERVGSKFYRAKFVRNKLNSQNNNEKLKEDHMQFNQKTQKIREVKWLEIRFGESPEQNLFY